MAFKIQAICPECSVPVGVSKRDGAEVIANHSVRSRVTFMSHRCDGGGALAVEGIAAWIAKRVSACNEYLARESHTLAKFKQDYESAVERTIAGGNESRAELAAIEKYKAKAEKRAKKVTK